MSDGGRGKEVEDAGAWGEEGDMAWRDRKKEARRLWLEFSSCTALLGDLLLALLRLLLALCVWSLRFTTSVVCVVTSFYY